MNITKKRFITIITAIIVLSVIFAMITCSIVTSRKNNMIVNSICPEFYMSAKETVVRLLNVVDCCENNND